jgi:hypothetical protein
MISFVNDLTKIIKSMKSGININSFRSEKEFPKWVLEAGKAHLA